MVNFYQKFLISLSSALLILFINLPQTYLLTNNLFNLLNLSLYNKITQCPTFLGYIIHSCVFFSLTLFGMGNLKEKFLLKLKNTLYGSILYLIIFNPLFTKMINTFISNFVKINIEKCITTESVIFMSFIYFIGILLIMYI